MNWINALPYIAVYLLCGVLTLLLHARHPWPFVRGFTAKHPGAVIFAWWLLALLVATDDSNPARREPRAWRWLLNYGAKYAKPEAK